ncbi:AAA family ATPase [Nitrosomonas marina]|uniref:Putative DNA primase/helicase n=1 Tax=Nitrosomonas marina TaxID=917 RepID=A0A1H8B4C2_9PROT|nr:AAA family ATPase [Nitrosomonas marina]SEM77596.1 putative DNA primase/helicase [Nitrosomonas marina]
MKDFREATEEEQAAYKTLNQQRIGTKANCIGLSDFLTLELPPRELLIAPWLPKQSLSMLFAWRGMGKSWLALSIGYAVASGGQILGWTAPKRYHVLYIDGELPAYTLQQRLTLIANSFDTKPEENGFKLITPDLQLNGIMPNLSDLYGREQINSIAQDVDLIILDNLSTLARGGRENESESWLPIQEWALQHRAQGRSVLFIHHSGKNGNQRGTSRKEDVLDTVINLRRPPDYESSDGAKFELHFEKARNLTGDEAMPLEVEMHSDHEKITWMHKPVSDSIIDRIEVFIEDGSSRQEIMAETGLSRFQLSRIVKKANESGRNIKLPDSRKK